MINDNAMTDRMQKMHTSRLRVPVLSALLALLAAGPALSQSSPPDVAATIACYEAEVLAGRRTGCPDGVRPVQWYVMHSGGASRADVEAVLDGLEDLARSDDLMLQIGAVSSIAAAGEDQLGRGPRIPVVHRLERLYASSEHENVRRSAVSGARRQIDTAAAIAFLERVARDRPRSNRYAISPQTTAIFGLSQMGAAGRAALDRLAAEDAVPDPIARSALEKLRRDGGS